MPDIYMCEKNALEGFLLRLDKGIDIDLKDNKKYTDEVKAEVSLYDINSTYVKEGKTARIYINGYLSNDAWFGTNYDSIIESINDANNDESIEDIILDINSPGGEVGKVDIVWNYIRNSKKPVYTEASGMVASGAYYIASATKRITSLSPGFFIGSIGVIVTGYVFTEEFFKRIGVKRIIIKSSNAKYKYNDPLTKEGESALQDIIDATERIFINRVAIGRGVSDKEIIEKYGQGLVFVSQDRSSSKPSALSRGMIDKVLNGFTDGEKTKRMGKMEITEKELDDKISNAVNLAVKNIKEDYKKKALVVSSILLGGNYPKSITELGFKVLKDESNIDSFQSAVSSIDAMMEINKQKEAIEIDKLAPSPISADAKKETKKVNELLEASDIEELLKEGRF